MCGIESDSDGEAWVDVVEDDEEKGGKIGWGLDKEKEQKRSRKSSGSDGLSSSVSKDKDRERRKGGKG